ncbi:hypothetical protein CEE44_00350 [Candidatus Woesearchaeota archaeon B3_Woes]|nr:MAG: hypothetical protein CEE44_00350 [Candidatus Woesearchaeota archaeon B3_Woes]
MNKVKEISLAAIVAGLTVASPLNAQELKFGEYNGGPNGGLRWHNGNASHFWACFSIYGVVKEGSHLIFGDVNQARIHGIYATGAAAFGKEALDLYLKRKEPNWPDWNGALNDLAYGAAGAGAAFVADEAMNYAVKAIKQVFKRNKKTNKDQNYRVNLVLSQNLGINSYRINLKINL